jgi:hypothetical protein
MRIKKSDKLGQQRDVKAELEEQQGRELLLN